jgi:hypothetical protein
MPLREVRGHRYTLPPALRAACVLSSVYASQSAKTCVSPALNAALGAMRLAALRSTSVDACERAERRERAVICVRRAARVAVLLVTLGQAMHDA